MIINESNILIRANKIINGTKLEKITILQQFLHNVCIFLNYSGSYEVYLVNLCSNTV